LTFLDIADLDLIILLAWGPLPKELRDKAAVTLHT
jgi:hypothetical protein